GASAPLRPERASRRGARLLLGMGPRDARVLDDPGACGVDLLGSRGVHLRWADRPARAPARAIAGHLAGPAIRVHPRGPRRDPSGRREHPHSASAHGWSGDLAGHLLLRVPSGVACRRPAVQRGGRLVTRYLRLLRIFFRTELQYELEYRLNLLLEIVQTIVVTSTSVAAVLVLFSYTTVLNGWDLGAMLVLLGCFYLVQGFGELVLQPSFEKFMEHVRLGTLDFALLKPVSAQFLVTLRNFQVVQLAQMGLGAIVVAVGLSRITSIGVAEAIGFPIALLCGFGLIYALLLALSTFAFWFVRVDNLMALYWSFMDAGRFPVDVYPGWLRVTLSSAVPIGVAVTVPAQVIAGRLDPLGLGLLMLGTIAAFVLASWFWRLGLRSYTGASA